MNADRVSNSSFDYLSAFIRGSPFLFSLLHMPLAAITWSDLAAFWPHLVGFVTLVVDLLATGHAILNKRDTRAAIGWVAIIWLVPVVGFVLYIWLGINRIQRKAQRLIGSRSFAERQALACACPPEELDQRLLPYGEPIRKLADYMQRVTSAPLLHGNRIEPLDSAEAAYPAMLQAIDDAKTSVTLCTYIFNNDDAGRKFVEALGRAAARGVHTRVLVDDIGARYHLPAVDGALEAVGVRVARFLPSLMPLSLPYSNLRDHRKILVADGRIGFTGGMNIRDCPLRDLHFRVTGPVVAQMQQVFADDWAFATKESLQGPIWYPPLTPVGEVLCRSIVDGPDENIDKLRMSIMGGLACARQRVTVWTPYFLPDAALITALNVTAMRGVEVNIILPEANNLTLVKWACIALLPQVLEHGCRVWYAPPPFDHTKLMVVDGIWVLLGSGNWDPRSLRLNFEFNVECYDRALAEQLDAQAAATIAKSRPITLAEVEGRSLPIKLRDGFARLFSPYL